MNWSKVRTKDLINPVKWWAFITGSYTAKKLNLQGVKDLEALESGLDAAIVDLSFKEQVMQRARLCTPCLENGSCIHCGCTMPDAFLAKENSCSEDRWGPMI